MVSKPTHRKVVVNASAADGREDETLPIKELNIDSADVASSESSLLPVISAVFAASIGSILFGYHLGVVNGPLEAIAADLGIAGNAVLQGSVGQYSRSSLSLNLFSRRLSFQSANA